MMSPDKKQCNDKRFDEDEDLYDDDPALDVMAKNLYREDEKKRKKKELQKRTRNLK